MFEQDVPSQLCLTGVCHGYAGCKVLHQVSLSIPAGQSCAIIGASGSGKSTLLNIMGLLDRPDSGRVILAGRDVTGADAAQQAMLRNRHIGFVFQSFNLLPRLNALDNVALPLRYRGVALPVARQAALAHLSSVGLAERCYHLPAELSGGQRQRVAIARALVGEPGLLLADEPTGNLDKACATQIIELLLALNRELAVTLVLVTHDPGIACRLQRCIEVHNGQVRSLP